ncbi:unnamed protein product [Rotaria sp. Silwood2]|nr:unnamed protein product [Rotaria sp. Silwood2]
MVDNYTFYANESLADKEKRVDGHSALGKKYPSLSTNQVIQILLLREDLTKQEATDTDDTAVAYMPRVNQGILFEIMEIVNQPN